MSRPLLDPREFTIIEEQKNSINIFLLSRVQKTLTVQFDGVCVVLKFLCFKAHNGGARGAGKNRFQLKL